MLRRWLSSASKKPPTVITQHRSNKLWLETPVNLKQCDFNQVKMLHSNLNLPENSNPAGYVDEIAAHAFQSAKSKLVEELTPEQLEEVRSLIAMAVFHDNDEAKLFAANLLLNGTWPKRSSSQVKNDQELTAKQKGMSVIKEIRKMQKANRLGYSSNPPKDPEMAVKLLREVRSPAVQGKALLELGDLHFFPNDPAQQSAVSQQEALDAYERAASVLGEPGAYYRLACAQLEVDKPELALQSFHNAADKENDADAHVYLGHHYKQQLVHEDSKAREHFNAAAKLGNTDAMVYLARWELELGNEYEALQHLVEASKRNNADAMHMLADAHVDGSLGLDVDLPRAITLYCKSGGEGKNAEAWMSAGALALKVLDNDEFAFQCYSKATDCCADMPGEVHNEAWRRLAHLYLAGKGVEKNEDTGNRILELIGDKKI